MFILLVILSVSLVNSQQNFDLIHKNFDLNYRGINSDGLCRQQLQYYQENLDQNVLWARVMRDSWGNVPAGIFSGNLFDFGSFDQCINFIHSSMNVTGGRIIGQHCTLMIPFELYEKRERNSKFTAPNRRYERHVIFDFLKVFKTF